MYLDSVNKQSCVYRNLDNLVITAGGEIFQVIEVYAIGEKLSLSNFVKRDIFALVTAEGNCALTIIPQTGRGVALRGTATVSKFDPAVASGDTFVVIIVALRCVALKIALSVADQGLFAEAIWDTVSVIILALLIVTLEVAFSISD
jgi:hypothetical protein